MRLREDPTFGVVGGFEAVAIVSVTIIDLLGNGEMGIGVGVPGASIEHVLEKMGVVVELFDLGGFLMGGIEGVTVG